MNYELNIWFNVMIKLRNDLKDSSLKFFFSYAAHTVIHKGYKESMHLPNLLAMDRMQHMVNFSMEYYWFWIQSFPSPRSVTVLRLKSQICLIIAWRRAGFLSFVRLLAQMKCKQLNLGFELKVPCPFLKMITIRSHAT